jgi:chromosome segregation ATPase
MDHLIERGINIIVREFGKKFDELEDEIQVHQKLQEEATTKYCVQRSRNDNLNAEVKEMRAERERDLLNNSRLRETLRMQNDALSLAYDHVKSASQKNQAKIETLEREQALVDEQNRMLSDALTKKKAKVDMLVNQWGELNCKPNLVSTHTPTRLGHP